MQSSFSLTTRTALFLLPLPLFAFLVWLKFSHSPIYWQIIQEDHILENQQFAFYLLAGLIAIPAARHFLKAGYKLHGILYSGLALMLVVVAMDEISWGQRIFNIETPEVIAERNVQDEITIHNLEVFQFHLHAAYIAVGAFGAFAWLLRLPFNPRENSIWRYVIADWYVSSWFFFLFLIYCIIDIAHYFEPTIFGHQIAIGNPVIFRDQEPAESFLATAFLIFVIDNYRKSKRLTRRYSA